MALDQNQLVLRKQLIKKKARCTEGLLCSHKCAKKFIQIQMNAGRSGYTALEI